MHPDVSSRGERLRVTHFALAVFAGAVLFAILARPLFSGEIYTASDLGNFYLPIRAFYSKCLAAGHGFIWFPNEFTGFYLHGEGQAGLFHPLNLLQYRILPLELAFNLELLRGYAFLLVGAFLLLRRWQLPRSAAAFGALLGTFSSFSFLHYMHLNILAAIAHLPWLLLVLHGVLWPRGRRSLAFGILALVLLTASQCLVGHPQFVFISAMVEAFYVACCLAGSRRSESSLALVRGRRVVDWGLAKLLGFGAAGIALVPLWEALGSSFRAAPPESFTSEFAITPLGLVQLVAPYLLETRVDGDNATELGFYLGAVPLLLVSWVLVRGRRLGSHWPVAAAALALGGFALLLSLGDFGLLYRLQSLLPVVGLFRAPARYTVVVQVASAAIAAIAFFDLTRHPNGVGVGRRGLWLWLPVLASLTALALVPLGVDGVASSRTAIAAGPVAIAIATGLVVASARGVRFATTALLLVALADAGVYGLSFVGRSPPQSIEAFLARFRAPEEPGVGRLHWGPPALTLEGFRIAGGYAAMTPDRVLDLGPFGRPLRLDARLRNALRVSDVRWAIGTSLPRPLPRARLVTAALVSHDPNREIGEVDVATTALVEMAVELDSGEPGEVTWVRDVPGEIELVTQAAGRQLLVLSERHHEGWRAQVDGAPCAVIRAYGDYMACAVPAGRHRVRFHFAPTSLLRGLQLSALSLGLMLLWLLLGLARSR